MEPKACCSHREAPLAGYSFFVKEGLMHYAPNYLGKATYRVDADAPYPLEPRPAL